MAFPEVRVSQGFDEREILGVLAVSIENFSSYSQHLGVSQEYFSDFFEMPSGFAKLLLQPGVVDLRKRPNAQKLQVDLIPLRIGHQPEMGGEFFPKLKQLRKISS